MRLEMDGDRQKNNGMRAEVAENVAQGEGLPSTWGGGAEEEPRSACFTLNLSRRKIL